MELMRANRKNKTKHPTISKYARMLEQKMIQRKKGIKFEFKSNLKGTE